ncbi:hypothetical protein B9Z55_018196 [Caenorhabditis nigoni]|nr:hypothetical protein B9Z55_018196 [Caenorhabditis nigoni]
MVSTLSLAIATKLFFFNWVKKGAKSKDLERANHLALIDAGCLFVFNIVPVFMVIAFPFFNKHIDDVMPLCKTGGFAIEGYLIKKIEQVSNADVILLQIRYRWDALLGRLMEFTGSFSLIQITFPYQIYVFITIWSVINLTSLRVFLVIFITVDRVFAVFLSITYHNTRRKIPNVFMMILAVWGPIMDNVYQWIICDHKFIFVPDCSSFGCLATMCFQQYTISYEISTASIVVGSSLILALKFFIWMNCKNKSKSNCLERANRLALLDAAMIFCFDLVPISVVALCPNVFFDVELALSLGKSSGYAVEGFLTYLTLKRRNTIIPQSNNLFLKTTSKQSS